MLRFIVFTLTLAVTVVVQASPVTDMLEANLKPRSWVAEAELYRDYAVSKQQDCLSWSPKAFEVQQGLWDSCQFPKLFKLYQARLKALEDSEKSGLVMPALQLENAQVPSLQSGAWRHFIMAEGEGVQTALEIILLRMAIEKSLVAQAQFIRQQAPQKILKPFAAFVVPRMIASFSAYSETLRSLVFISHVQCKEVTAELKSLKAQILAGMDRENFLAGLTNMNGRNSGRDILKAKKVAHLAQLLSQVKKELTLKELMSSLSGQGVHPIYLELVKNLSELSTEFIQDENPDVTHMLVAVSILAEIGEVQKIKGEFPVEGANLTATSLSVKTAEEVNVLKSLVLKVLSFKESVQ